MPIGGAGGRKPPARTGMQNRGATGAGLKGKSGGPPVMACGPRARAGSRAGMQSRQRRRGASTCICRLLKSASGRPQAEQGSGEVCGTGWLAGGFSGLLPSIAAWRTSVGTRLVGMHSKHLRFGASTFICRLL